MTVHLKKNIIPDYIIEYKTVKSKVWTKIITVSGSVYEHCIENLKEKSDLLFRISAENAVGISVPAESQTVRLEKYASKYTSVLAVNYYRQLVKLIAYS